MMDTANTSGELGYPILGPFRPVVPLYVIGDSHALAFNRLTFDEDVTGATFATRARYIASGFTGPALWSAAAGLHPELLAALEYEGLLRDGRAVHFSTADRTDLALAGATEQPQMPPILLVMCGDIDVRGGLLPLLKDGRDFVPAGPTPYPHTDRPLLPFDLLRRAVAERADPLVQGILALQAVGFTRTYLHCVVPPSADDARFRALHGYDCPAATRYKAARLFNEYVAAECGKAHIPFIDLWPETTTPDGYLRPEFELDGVHLPRAATRITLHKVLQHALSRMYMATNYPRYDLYYRRCLGRPDAVPEVVPEVVAEVAAEVAPPPAPTPEPPPPVAPEPVAAAPSPIPAPTPVAAGPMPSLVPVPKSGVKRAVKRVAKALVPHGVRHALRVALGRAPASNPAAVAPPPVAVAPEPAAPPAPAAPAPEPVPAPPAPPAAPVRATIQPVKVVSRPPAICTADGLPDVAPGSEPWVADAVGQFRADGIALLKVERELAERWRGLLDFSLDMANRSVRWDWVGEARKPFTAALRTAAFTPDVLTELRALFTRPAMDEFFRGCLGCPMTVLNCRPVRSLVHENPGFGPQSWHGDGCPAGVIRGILYLNDVDEEGGPFQYRDRDGGVRSVTGECGTLFVFDANRLVHRGCPPKARERFVIDFIFHARWPDDPFRIVSASINAWPADPFHYTTDGFTVFPPDPRPVHRKPALA